MLYTYTAAERAVTLSWEDETGVHHWLANISLTRDRSNILKLADKPWTTGLEKYEVMKPDLVIVEEGIVKQVDVDGCYDKDDVIYCTQTFESRFAPYKKR